MFNARLSEFLKRYIGESVVIKCFAYQKYIGTVKGVTDEFVLLSNAVQFGELEGSQWEEQAILGQLEDGQKVGFEETIVLFNHITSIGCHNEVLTESESEENSICEGASTEESNDPSYIDQVDPVEIRFGAELIVGLLGKSETKVSLLGRIQKIRKELIETLGFAVPPIHLKDDLGLDSNEYEVRIRGNSAGKATIWPGERLVLMPGDDHPEIQGRPYEDPSFGIDGVWITNEVDERDLDGCTVVDASTVLITHLCEILKQSRHHVLTYSTVCNSLDRLSEIEPELVAEHFQTAENRMWLFRVLAALLDDRVWIGDFSGIARSVAMNRTESKDLKSILTGVRTDISPHLLRNVVQEHTLVPVLALDPPLEHELVKTSINKADPAYLETLQHIQRAIEASVQNETPLAFIVTKDLREEFARFIRRCELDVPVISYDEFPSGYRIDVREMVRLCDIEDATRSQGQVSSATEQ